MAAACSVANVLFSALTLSGVLICMHGATRVPDDLFLDESDVGSSQIVQQWQAAGAAAMAGACPAPGGGEAPGEQVQLHHQGRSRGWIAGNISSSAVPCCASSSCSGCSWKQTAKQLLSPPGARTSLAAVGTSHHNSSCGCAHAQHTAHALAALRHIVSGKCLSIAADNLPQGQLCR